MFFCLNQFQNPALNDGCATFSLEVYTGTVWKSLNRKFEHRVVSGAMFAPDVIRIKNLICFC